MKREQTTPQQPLVKKPIRQLSNADLKQVSGGQIAGGNNAIKW